MEDARSANRSRDSSPRRAPKYTDLRQREHMNAVRKDYAECRWGRRSPEHPVTTDLVEGQPGDVKMSQTINIRTDGQLEVFKPGRGGPRAKTKFEPKTVERIESTEREALDVLLHKT